MKYGLECVEMIQGNQGEGYCSSPDLKRCTKMVAMSEEKTALHRDTNMIELKENQSSVLTLYTY